MIHYALFTAALSAWLDRLRIGRATFLAAAVAMTVAVTLEATQVVINSRQPAGFDAAVRVAGVLAGSMLWQLARKTRSPHPWLLLLATATAVAVAVEMLSPFEVADARRPFGWVPFAGYYQNNWFPSVSHLVELVLLYFPLGFCAGLVAREARMAVLLIVAAVLVISIPVEYLPGVDRRPLSGYHRRGRELCRRLVGRRGQPRRRASVSRHPRDGRAGYAGYYFRDDLTGLVA